MSNSTTELRCAPDALERERLLDAINAGYAALRSDPTAWDEEIAERDHWDSVELDRRAPHAVHCTSGGTGLGGELKKVPACFYRNENRTEPVRYWLQGLDRESRKRIGADIATVEYGWPVGMPTCRPMGSGLWEVRTNLEDGRIARVLFCLVEDHMILLHGFIKKTQNTPKADLDVARKRMKEVT